MRSAGRIAFFFALICAAPHAFADSCKLALLAEWPVRLVAGLPIVEGAINGQRVGVLLDTGASRSMIFRTAAARLALPRHSTNNRVYGVGGSAAAEMVHIDEFRIGKIARKNWQVLAVGEREFGRNVAFIVGADLLDAIDLEIDYAGGFVRLFRPHDCAASPLAYWSKDGAGVVDIDRDTRIRFTVLVNGKPVSAMLDTGASNSILELPVARQLGVEPGSPGVIEAGCTGGLGANVIDQWVGLFESFTIGDQTTRNPRLMISDFWMYTTAMEVGSRITQRPAGRPSMLIGTDFLRTHRVYVGRSQYKLYFTYLGGLVFPSVPAGACRTSRQDADLQARPNDSGEKLASLDKALAADSRNAQLLLTRGIELLGHKQYDRAIADFDSALRLGTTHAALHFHRGMAWYLKEDYSAAIADFDEAIRLDPRVASSYRARAAARALLGDDESAIADYDRALALDPRSKSVLRSRGYSYYRLGRYDAAAQDFVAYTSNAPKQVQDVVWKYLAQARAGREARAELQSDFTASVAGDWPEPLIRFHLGQLDQDALAAAAAHPDEKRRNEQECEATFHIAQRWLIAQDVARARPLLQKAQDQCPHQFVEYLGARAELKRLP